MKYLLDILRQNISSKKNYSEQCIAVIPSTETWIFIECSKILHNISFLCEYTSQDKSISRLDVEQTYSKTQYCNHGWHLMIDKCVKVIGIETNYSSNYSFITNVDWLNAACLQIGGKMFDIESHLDRSLRQFVYYTAIFFKQGFHCVAMSRNKTDVDLQFLSNVGHREDLFMTGAFYLPELKMPYILDYNIQLSVLCHQEVKTVNDTCMQGYVACRNGECIPEVYFCDGFNHCSDASDESNCSYPCTDPSLQSLYFKCHSTMCIPISRVCDLIIDCEDGDDEQECPDDENYNPLWSPLIIKRQTEECIVSTSEILHFERKSFFKGYRYDTESLLFQTEKYDDIVCPFASTECYPLKYLCTLDKDITGNELPCKNAWQWPVCQDLIFYNMRCNDKFKCNSGD